MSTSAVHIELSWLSCILAAYLDVLGTTTYVESLLETECILLAVNGNSTLATDVDDTQARGCRADSSDRLACLYREER